MTAAESSPRARIVQQLIDTGATAVVRMENPQGLLRVAEAIYEGGITAIEVTMTVPDALRMIEAVAREMGEDVLLGVGSVLDAETARRAIEAGAQFVISPVFKEELIEASHRHEVPVVPGAFSPTEIQRAHEAGADLVKVFPASVLGKSYIKAIKAPLPHLRLVPTGGVTLENAGDWLRAGASAVAVGSALLDKAAIAEENYAKLTENARVLRRNLDAARSPAA